MSKEAGPAVFLQPSFEAAAFGGPSEDEAFFAVKS